MKTVRLSVCLIVKNEEGHLIQCLESIREVADEIIVVDTGSTDRTGEIANHFTDKVYSIKWWGNFSKARNSALAKATGEWILFLDGDEMLDTKSRIALRSRLQQEEFEGYHIKVLNHYSAGNRLEIAADAVFRLFRNRDEYRYTGAVYEQIYDNILSVNPKALIGFAEDICLIHFSDPPEAHSNKSERNIRLLLKAIKKKPNNLLDHFHLGVEYFYVNKLDSARDEFLIVLGKMDLQAVYAPKLLRYLTTCHYLLGDHEKALEFIDKVWTKAYKDHGDLYYLRGLINKEIGRYCEAYNDFQTCLSVPPQPANYANLYCQHKDKTYNHLGEIAEYFMDKENALEFYIQALKYNPRCGPALARIIGILQPRENPEYTIKALNSVFDLNDYHLKFDLGNYFFQERAYSLAVQFIDEAASISALSFEAHGVKGMALMRLKDYNRAVHELSKVPPGNSAFATARKNLFFYYLLHKSEEEASACLSYLRSFEAGSAMVETLEYLLKNQHVTASDLKNSLPAITGEVVENLKTLVELEEWESLDELLDCFEELFPFWPHKLLGDMFYSNGAYDRALEQYLLIDNKEVDAETNYHIGKIYWTVKDYTKAEVHFSLALNNGCNTPKVNWAMARLHQDIAISLLEEEINLCPNNQRLQSSLTKLKENLIEV